MQSKTYTIGLLKSMLLKIEGETSFQCLFTQKNLTINLLVYNNDYSLEIESEEKCERVDKKEIERGVKSIISEDGSRWEGDWYNQQPFGFGSVYDGEGNRIYCGFMFEGKKIGFGTEFFSDNHKVDYCGNFINDKRHGWGTTYDRNGQKLYEGNWRCGKNDFENEKIVIEDNCEEDCLRIHDLIKELEIGENCWNEWENDLIFKDYPNLQSIVVKKNLLKNLNSLKICNCEKLKTIDCRDGDYDNGVFNNVENVIIESILEIFL